MPPSTPPECRPQRQRPPRRVVVESGALLSRGLAELRPRRLSYPKLAATAVRQMAFKSLRPVAGASVHMPLGAADADLTLRLLADVPDVTLAPSVFPTFLDQLHVLPPAGEGGRRIVVVLGDGEVPRGDTHAALARSLAGFNPQIEQRLAQELFARSREGATAVPGDLLVVEERPGKALALSLEETTVKVNAKRWQALASRPASDAPRPPLDTPDGWGVGGLVLATPEAGGGRTVTLASFDGQLPGDSLNLDSGRQIREAAAAWLQATAGLGLGSLRRVVLSVPWLAVAATVGAAFAPPGGPVPKLLYPDLVYGWQPFLTLLDFLYGEELPALFVYTGRFPDLHLVALW